MWMACYTQEEIAKACGCSQDTVKRKVSGFNDFDSQGKIDKTAASEEDDEEAAPFVTFAGGARGRPGYSGFLGCPGPPAFDTMETEQRFA